MPTDVTVFVAAIAGVFIIFAAVLAWADYHTSKRRPGPAE